MWQPVIIIIGSPAERRVSEPSMNAGFQCGGCKVIASPAFYDALSGPSEYIISIVNSLKMVNMP